MKTKISFLILLIVVLAPFSLYAEDQPKYFVGMNAIFGEQWKEDPGWNLTIHRNCWEYQFNPVVGLHLSDRWDLWAEGKIGYLDWKDYNEAVKLGLNIMTSYDVIKYKDWRFYGEFGVGIGGRSYSPSNHVLGTSILGFVDYGVGVKYEFMRNWFAKIGVRFEHSSSIPAHDTGINSYTTLIGILKYF